MMTLVREHRTKELADNNKGGIERRRGLRIRQNRPIKVYNPNLARYFGGQTQDVSATGPRIELPMSRRSTRQAAERSRWPERVRTALANRRQMIPAKVIWIDRDLQRTDGRMTAGVEFLATTAAHRDAA